jgi:hypothetical protein
MAEAYGVDAPITRLLADTGLSLLQPRAEDDR